jgi:hypothetical protein
MAYGTQKPPKGWLIAGVVCLFLGLSGCGAAVIGAVSLIGVIDDVATPTEFGTERRFSAESDSQAMLLLTEEVPCEVIGDTTGDVRIEEFAASVPLEGGNENFTVLRTFETIEGENYQVTCGDRATNGSFAVAELPGLLTGAMGAVIFGGGILGGALMLVLGVIFLIIGLVQRSRWKKNQSGTDFGGPGGYQPPAPGGYQPPPPPGGAQGFGQQPPPPGGTQGFGQQPPPPFSG